MKSLIMDEIAISTYEIIIPYPRTFFIGIGRVLVVVSL